MKSYQASSPTIGYKPRKSRRKTENLQSLPKVWDAAKTVLRRKCIVMNAYINAQEIANKQPNFTPQGIREQRKPKLLEGITKSEQK